jgi:hypothetical protein
MVVLLSIRKTGFYSANGNKRKISFSTQFNHLTSDFKSALTFICPFVDSRWQFICSYVDDK